MKTLDSQIQYYEKKLSMIHDEYKTSMTCKWSAIREKELFFRREICRLDNIKKDIELKNKYFKTPVVIKKQEDELKTKDKEIHEVKEVMQKNNIEYITSEDEQWEINNKFLLESYEEEENNAQSYQDFIDSLDDEELCNLDNAMEGLDIISENIDSSIETKIELMNQEDCEHDWIKGRGDYNIKCTFCIFYPSQENRLTCSKCLKQACASCLRINNQKWRQEVELEPEDKLLISRVRNLENRINSLEAELEELRSKIELNEVNKIEENERGMTELKDQAISNRKNDKAIQLKDTIINFGSKYIVKLPFKKIIGIRVPVKVKLTPNISYKILALVDTGCTKNIIHDKYFVKCP